jgi:hypothetical protein
MQSNTQSGLLPIIALEAIAANLLVSPVNNAGVLNVQKPNDKTDEVLYVIQDAATAGALVDCIPLSTERNVRATLSGTCNPGAQLILATPNGTVDGMVKTLPVTAGTYRLVGIAEEAGVDGQAVLFRPVGSRLITVV